MSTKPADVLSGILYLRLTRNFRGIQKHAYTHHTHMHTHTHTHTHTHKHIQTHSHEAPITGGFGAEVAAAVQEKVWHALTLFRAHALQYTHTHATRQLHTHTTYIIQIILCDVMYCNTLTCKCFIQCFLRLEAPVQRVCGYDTPFPLAHEKIYVPDALKVFSAIRRAVSY